MNNFKKAIYTINKFDSLKSSSVEVNINLKDNGKFLIEVSNDDKRVSIQHAWNDNQNESFDSPGTIDLIFDDKIASSATDRYLIIMSECEIESFPINLRNAYELTDAFIKNNFTIEKTNNLLFRQTKLVFDIEGTYKIATKIKS